jgi:hypothetical protein
LLVEGTNLDINSLDFVGAGTITAASSNALNLNTTSANIALATATSGNITLTTGAASGLVNVLTGNLRVGTGNTEDLTLNGEDAFIEGTLEVDSATRLDGALTANAAVTLQPGSTDDVTVETDSDSKLIVNGLSGVTGPVVCVETTTNIIGTCATGSITLQSAYNGGNVIDTTDGRDIDFILDDDTTDSNFDIDIVADNTVSISRAASASSEAPSQLLLLENLDDDVTVGDGILIQSTGSNDITDGLDVSDSEIVNAVNVGDNNILGTTAVINFTNFDVDASGNAILAGTLAVNGDTITSDGDLTITAAGGNIITGNALNVGGGSAQAYNFFSDGAGTVDSASSDDDLYIEDILEVDGGTFLTPSGRCRFILKYSWTYYSRRCRHSTLY